MPTEVPLLQKKPEVKPSLTAPIVVVAKPQTNAVFDGTTKRIAFNPQPNSQLPLLVVPSDLVCKYQKSKLMVNNRELDALTRLMDRYQVIILAQDRSDQRAKFAAKHLKTVQGYYNRLSHFRQTNLEQIMRDFKQRDCYFVTTYHDSEDENPAPKVQGYRHVICLPEDSPSLSVLENTDLCEVDQKQYLH